MGSPTPLRDKIRRLPDAPGVYLFRDASGEVLYVGKARSVRRRVLGYFQSPARLGVRLHELVRRVADVEVFVVDNETEALVLENTLIKEHAPRFNVQLRDDKTYPYVKVTVQEPFPRVLVTRRLEDDGARYYGPYTNVGALRQVLGWIRQLYAVRSCHYALPDQAPDRPCLDYHIGRCRAPCVGLQSRDDYRRMIDGVLDLLEGRIEEVATRVRRDLQAAVATLEFERAAELRDVLRGLEAFAERQRVVDPRGRDLDVLGLARDASEAVLAAMRVRGGRVVAREGLFSTNADEASESEILDLLVTRLYTVRSLQRPEDVPPVVIVPTDFPDRQPLERLLRERTGRRVRVLPAGKGRTRDLIALAAQNARLLLYERRADERTTERNDGSEAVRALANRLGLPQPPRRIVGCDIAHLQGHEPTAAVVAFVNGRPDKRNYRSFTVRSAAGNDDFQSIAEVVARYARRVAREEWPRPDLWLVDGGPVQLRAAREALEAAGLGDTPVIALAKRFEWIYRPSDPEPLRLPRNDPALRLLQQIRDEAHRFARRLHHRRCSRAVRDTALAQVPGVGPVRLQRLLQRFGSLDALKRASVEEIAAVPGIGRTLAAAILDHLADRAARSDR